MLAGYWTVSRATLLFFCLNSILSDPRLFARGHSSLGIEQKLRVNNHTHWLDEHTETSNASFIEIRQNKHHEFIYQLHNITVYKDSLPYIEDYLERPLALCHNKEPLLDWLVYAFTTRFSSYFYNDIVLHTYEDSRDIINSFTEGTVDAKLCREQLGQLSERAQIAAKEKFLSKDLNLLQLLNTYGRPPPGYLGLDLFWTGKYDECLELEIEMQNRERKPTRYCIASLGPLVKPSNFTKPFSDTIAFKIGVCLPKACDSFYQRDKFELIESLIEINFGALEKDQLRLNDLYCLPERGSPLLSWWRSPKTLITVVGLGIWLSIIIYATFKYDGAPKTNLQTYDLVGQKDARLTDKFSLEEPKTNRQKSSYLFRVIKSFSLTRNLKNLFCPTRRRPKKENPQRSSEERRKIDFGCLDGLKVIFMFLVIFSHVLARMTLLFANVSAIDKSQAITLKVSGFLIEFVISGFFFMTGILNSYLLLKKNQRSPFMSRPSSWWAFILTRYMRLVPTFVVVVLFCKYIIKYTGSGPHWDYGTSSTAPRRICEQESWLWTIFIGSNLKPLVLEQCTPSAWYLGADLQYHILTPIFLFALSKNQRIGTLLLKSCIVISCIAPIIGYVSADVEYSRPIVLDLLRNCRLFFTIASFAYGQPQYRIAPYLIGLLFGYKLFLFEQDTVKYRATRAALEAEGKDLGGLEEPCWSHGLRKYGAETSILVGSVFLWLSYVVPYFPRKSLLSQIFVIFFISNYHTVFSIALGNFILLAVTGDGIKPLNSFLALNFWKPLAKVGLCVSLINSELIGIIMGTTREQMQVTFYSHASLNLFCLVAVYAVSIITYLLFQAPIDSILKYPFSFSD